MYVTTYRRQKDSSLTGVLCFFDEWLKVSNCSLHYLRRLQNERQLHFTLTEKLTNYLHAFK